MDERKETLTMNDTKKVPPVLTGRMMELFDQLFPPPRPKVERRDGWIWANGLRFTSDTCSPETALEQQRNSLATARTWGAVAEFQSRPVAPPRPDLLVIETERQADELPSGSVVRSSDETICRLRGTSRRGWWPQAPMLPMVLLWHPDWAKDAES
jgi:hypothetical protein